MLSWRHLAKCGTWSWCFSWFPSCIEGSRNTKLPGDRSIRIIYIIWNHFQGFPNGHPYGLSHVKGRSEGHAPADFRLHSTVLLLSLGRRVPGSKCCCVQLIARGWFFRLWAWTYVFDRLADVGFKWPNFWRDKLVASGSRSCFFCSLVMPKWEKKTFIKWIFLSTYLPIYLFAYLPICRYLYGSVYIFIYILFIYI